MDHVSTQTANTYNCSGIRIHYLTIPKTGSTTTAAMLTAAMLAAAMNADHVNTCGAIRVHDHETTDEMARRCGLRDARMLAPTTFTVIREPCQRFASSFDYIRTYGKKRERNITRGNVTVTKKYVLKPNDPVHAMASPVEWARALLKNATYRRVDWADLMPDEAYRLRNHFLKDVLMIAKQIWWLGPSTELVCLTHLRDELSELVSRHAPGCKINRELPDRNMNSIRTFYEPSVLCPLVRQLYPEDSVMWERRCLGALPMTGPQTRRALNDLGPLAVGVAAARKTRAL